MLIHLKRNERLYVNGAVLQVDRRVSLTFLNDVHFLMEAHVMQSEAADTPFKQLYYVVQTMLIDPSSAEVTAEVFKHVSHRLRCAVSSPDLVAALDAVQAKVAEGRCFDALKLLRGIFPAEARLLASQPRETAA